MKFGMKGSEIPATEDEAPVGSYIKYFPKNGDYRLRFLEEVPEWTRYYEHFHQEKQRSFPCTGDKQNCPGCTSPNEKTASANRRWLVNAFNPQTGYVDLYKIPTSIKGDFDRFSDKDDGTIKNRDYTIVRYEEDGRTRYSVDREDREVMDLTELTQHLRDHQEALADAYIEVWGGLPGEEKSADTDGLAKPVSISRSAKPSQASLRQMISNKDAYTDPPSEPASAPVDAEQGNGTTEISEDELRKMTTGEIRDLYLRCGLKDPGPNKSADQLTDELIELLA